MTERRFRPGLGWPVWGSDHANEKPCKACGATVVWVEIPRKARGGKTAYAWHPLSLALAKREGEHTYLGSHYADCPEAAKMRKRKK